MIKIANKAKVILFSWSILPDTPYAQLEGALLVKRLRVLQTHGHKT
jgi:hypothetical protein